MPVINRALTYTLYLPNTSKPLTITLARHFSSTSSLSRDSQFHRSDFQSQGAGFTSHYDPDQPTRGPLAQASKHGAPRLTPTLLKEHLDKFVVGQDKAKKVVSVAVFNHYQRIRELQRQEAEDHARREREKRWELSERERRAHPVENEFPGHVESVDLNALSSQRDQVYSPPSPEPEMTTFHPLEPITPHTQIEKSNLLLLGPSGVGKTYIISTLASILSVPFATVDCSALTQAGYIGTDIESAIERLLLASDHNPSRCETGIIFFDEVDKLAKPAVMTHGRDVSGEGVQQGLLKMIEGTTVTVNAKADRNSKTDSKGSDGGKGMERGRETTTSTQGAHGAGMKSEQYTIDTKNILFVFAGAFVGLDKIISSRLSSGTSLGFGAKLRNNSSSSSTTSTNSHHQSSTPVNPLQNLQSVDLQKYGLIPELVGRIPILTTLSPLSLEQLVSILTEPKNSLVKQYTALLQTSNIQLRFTTGALWGIAERALYGKLKTHYNPSNPNIISSKTNPQEEPEDDLSAETIQGTGARGLRSIMESILFNLMFKGPGSAIRYSLIDERFVREQGASIAKGGEDDGLLPRCWSRGQGTAWEDAWVAEEDRWRRRKEGKERDGERDDGGDEMVVDLRAFRRVGGSGM